jgi:hypothetical protein
MESRSANSWHQNTKQWAKQLQANSETHLLGIACLARQPAVLIPVRQHNCIIVHTVLNQQH